ncbi:hypothetical protein BDV95DRAFT_80216 [Massariosphaeria phaeospora]|uniref:C3H1-type domain-containing protein n=1 Tax=Massariosphaeria phaeospora TaxID=100035 RepID=A0A7C8MIV7_9PLEO|nr:hypothetical protein BDV95DRAFT_80216 [Massariosphaeria phaeospora]
MDTTDAIAGCMDEIKSIVRVLETWRQLEPQERIWVSKRKPAELPPLDPGLQDHRSAESVIATFVVDYLRRADMIEVLAWFWNQIRVELKGVILANNRDKFLNIFYNNILEPSLTVFEALTTVGGKVCPLYQQEARNLPWDTAALISIHKRVRKRVPREEDAIRVCRGIQKIVTVLRTEPQVDPSECQSETSVPTNVESGLGIRQDERFDWRCLEIKQLWSANVGFLRDIVDEKQSIAGLDDEKTEQLSQFITMLHDLIGPLHEIIRDIDSHEEIDREISKAQEERNQIWLDITAFREELMSLQAQERPTEDCETALKAMMTTLEDANHKVALSRPRNMKRRLLLEATAVDVKMLSGVLFAMTLMPNSIVTNPLRRIIHTLCYTDPPEPFEIADHHLRTEAFRIVDVCADLQAEVQDPFPSDIRKTLLDKLKDLYTGLWSSSDRASVRLLICEAPLEEIQEAAHEVKMRYNALVKAQNNSKLMLAYGVLLQDLDHRADVLRNISEESSEDDDSDDEQKDIAECEERIVKRPVEFNRNLDFDAPENILTDEERERKEFLLLTGETSVVEIQKMTTVLERYIRQYHSKESGRDPVRKQRYKYMAYKLARHLNSYISTNLAKCKDIIWKHVNWQHARSVADRFVKDDLHMVQGFKEKLCIKVNTPQGCKFGKRCYFSHRAEGKMCREPEGKCPRTDCAYVHGEAPILFKHSSAAEVGKEYPDEDEVPQAMAADHMPQDTPKAPVQHRTPQHNRNAPVQKQTPRNNMDTPVQDQTPQHNLDTPAQDQTQVQMQALMALAMKIPMMLPPSNSNFGMPQNIAQQPYSGAGGHFPPHRTQHFQNQQVGPGPMRFNTMQPGYVQDGNGYVHYQQGPFAQNNGFMSAQVPGQRASQIHFKNQFNGHNGFQQDNNGYDHYQQEPLVQNNGFMGAQVPGQRASQIHVENQFSGGHNGFQQGNGMGGQHGYGNGHNSHNNQNSRGGGGGGGSRGNKSRYKGRSKWKHAAFQDDDIGPKARPQSAPKHLRNNGSRKRAHGQDSEDQPDSAREPKRRCRGEDSD